MRSRTGYPPRRPSAAVHSTGHGRLTDPVYRRRALEFAADAVLAALAFALAFPLRFLDDGGMLPERYETMLLGSIVFVAIGKALVFELLGLHQQWWRYFRLPDLWPLCRALAVASAAHGRWSSCSPSPTRTACRAR